VTVTTRSLFIMVWAIVWSTLVAWQVFCIRTGRPPFGDLVRLLRDWWFTRWVLLLGWFWLGWHFFVRGAW
jgi:hypothetical protein